MSDQSVDDEALNEKVIRWWNKDPHARYCKPSKTRYEGRREERWRDAFEVSNSQCLNFFAANKLSGPFDSHNIWLTGHNNWPRLFCPQCMSPKPLQEFVGFPDRVPDVHICNNDGFKSYREGERYGSTERGRQLYLMANGDLLVWPCPYHESHGPVIETKWWSLCRICREKADPGCESNAKWKSNCWEALEMESRNHELQADRELHNRNK